MALRTYLLLIICLSFGFTVANPPVIAAEKRAIPSPRIKSKVHSAVRVPGNRVRLNRGDRVVRQPNGSWVIYRRGRPRGVSGNYACTCKGVGTCTVQQGPDYIRCEKQTGDTCNSSCFMTTTKKTGSSRFRQ